MINMTKTIIVLGALALAGCSTIFDPGPDHVRVTSSPVGAAVTVDGLEQGTTPTVISLDRNRSGGVIRVDAPGHVTYTVVRTKNFNGVSILNFFNPIFWAVDLVSGNYQEFDDTEIRAVLRPLPAE